jgi:hypothetical protein
VYYTRCAEMLNIKLPGLPSLDQIINQSPIAQAAGLLGAAALGVADKPSVTQGMCDPPTDVAADMFFAFRGVRRSGALFQVRVDGVRYHHPRA